jgi:hypothetical protein
MPKGSMSTVGETLQASVLYYRCLIAAFCCACLGCCAAKFGSYRGTNELPYSYRYLSCMPDLVLKVDGVNITVHLNNRLCGLTVAH